MSISTQDMEVAFHDGTSWRTIPIVCLVKLVDVTSKKFWENEVETVRRVYKLPYDVLIIRERRGW